VKKDALQLPSLNCIWEEVGGSICWLYDGFSSPLLMPSWLSPPAARRKGIRLLSSDGTNDSMTNEDHDKKVNQVASCKAQESVNIHTAKEDTNCLHTHSQHDAIPVALRHITRWADLFIICFCFL
jgi:hypothetical protein